MQQIVALFGEAEKGVFKKPYVLRKLPQLYDLLGNPPHESQGLFFAVQAILYNREIIYFRVAEEGFSPPDYFTGLKYLEDKAKRITALCMPGVGNPEILTASQSVCEIHKSFLITNQKDLYDFLTSN
ncbi:MAG TPA: hypothetical protein VLF94_04920 [Chlamydiales bacterium]|nr:hypothetical protein [Chlamydiales bacterium]